MTGTRKTSYVLFAASFVLVIALKLGPVLLAGLVSYMILDLTHRQLKSRLPDIAARWLAVLTFAITAWGIAWLFWKFTALALQKVPVILGTVIPHVDGLASSYGIQLPFENLEELKEIIIRAVKVNAGSITHTSGILTKGVFQVLVGLFVAVLAFLNAGAKPRPAQANLYDQLRRDYIERVQAFMLGFEKVLGAQVLISAINTCITAVFLVALGMPFVPFLVLSTFIFGMLPLIGNVLSNTIIVGTALTLSPQYAVFSLIFLVVIHKAEYFLNSRIVGGSIETPMWLTLLGILIGEVLMGVPGIMLAPTLIHYVRGELQAVKS